MAFEGMIASTHVDAHNTCITLEALEAAAESITHGKSVPSVGVEHDPAIMPIGKLTSAQVKKLDDGEYGLFCKGERFEAYPLEVGGTKFIVQKSLSDDRPLIMPAEEEHKKLYVCTDAVNFRSRADAKAFLGELSAEYDIETGYCARKSAVPDPELLFQFLETSVKYFLAYLASKPVLEKVGDHVVDRALVEADNLYAFVRKTILSAAKRFVPINRPVSYVFVGRLGFVVELVVQTADVNTALEAISKEKLMGVVEQIDDLQKLFSSFVKVQLVYDVEEKRWEFNYIATEKGEIIGTEKSYERSMKKMEIALPQGGTLEKQAVSVMLEDVSSRDE